MKRTDAVIRPLLLSSGLAVFGDSLLVLTLVVWAKELTGSNASAGLVYALLSVPALFSLAGGSAIDRIAPRRAVLVVSVFSIVAVVPLYLVHTSDMMWLFYACTVTYGLSTYLFQCARIAAVALLVPPAKHPSILAILRGSRQIILLVSPALGTLLFATAGLKWALVATMCLFGLTPLLIWRVGAVRPPPAAAAHSVGDTFAGIAFILRTAQLRRLCLGLLSYMLCAGFLNVCVVALLDRTGLPPRDLGIASLTQGIGSAVGAVIVTRQSARRPALTLVSAGLLVATLGSACVATGAPTGLFVGVFLAGLSLPAILVGCDITLMASSPAGMQGRVGLAFEVTTGVPLTLSFFLAAATVDRIGPQLIMGVSVAASLVSVFVIRSLRADDRTTEGITGAL